MLKGIKIHNYRGIRLGGVDKLGRINLFVGANGSGKSTLLEAIFLGATGPAALYRGTKLLAARHNESTFPSEECVFAKGIPAVVEVEYDFDGWSATLRGRDEFKWQPPTELPADWLAYFASLRLLDVRLLLDKEPERQAWDALLNQRGDRALVRAMNDVYHLRIESFSYSVHSQVLKALFEDRPFALNIDDLATGMRIAFRLFLSVLLSRNSAVLIEEVDGFQHVESFGRFVNTLCSLASQVNTQLFIATHSEETVAHLVNIGMKDPELDIAVFQTKLTTDGTFLCARLEAPQADGLLAGGIDLRRTG